MLMLKKEKIAAFKYKEYIEGATSFGVFWGEYIVSDDLMKYLSKAARKKNIGCVDEIYFSVNPTKKRHPDFRTKYLLQKSIIYYLEKKRIAFKVFVKEWYLFEKWDDYIPNFVPYDESFYYLLEELDNGARHSKKYYRDFFSKIYRYEKYPPNWMHMAEWPLDDDGTPTEFLFQTGFPNSHDFIEYWFRKKNGSKVKVEQYD